MTRNPDDIKRNTLQLPRKPNANLHYTFLRGDPSSQTLIIFLNGLIMPQTSWSETLLQIKLKTQAPGSIPRPHLLSYDRYGQGTSDKDPSGPHDIKDSVHDLYDLLHQINETENLNFDVLGKKQGTLVFVCNSIGCAIARLFAEKYPNTVSSFLFLDSIMANSDFVSLFPDPEDPAFNAGDLPEGTTVQDLLFAREMARKRFSPSLPNAEGLDRGNLRILLPRADGPKVKAPEGFADVVVVGHEWEKFAEENEQGLGIKKALVMRYVNTAWHTYNKGLTQLTEKDRAKGPIIALGCSHFIQKDDPVLVAELVCDMLAGF